MTDRNRLRRHVLRGGAALAVLLASVLHISARSQGNPFGAAQGRPADAAPVMQPFDSAQGKLAAAQSPRIANYDIDVTLDPATRTITGSEVITWRNPGQIPAYSIRLHLYWNAFRNTNSTWLKQRRLAGDNPFEYRNADDFGYTNVTRLVRLNDDGSEADLMKDFKFISPDDQNTDDRTLAAATLVDAVEPGGTMRLRVEWTGRFPRNFDRTGAIGNYFFVSQWFPKLGVFEAGGWNARQFFANSEFYADFGNYDVRITVPAGWMVGATGVEQSRTDADPSTTLGAGGTTTHRYAQEDVHDFAWTTSPDFIEKRQQFELPGRAPVQLRLLIQPEHEGQADRHFTAAAAALKYYGEWYGAYPYPTLTIVDPVFQSDSGGMEYPTIFTAGTRWLAPRGSNEPEYVVLHEAGHQFWHGLVANNEVEFAWLDEGINEYTDSRVQDIALQPNFFLERFFGGFIPWQYRDIPLKRTDTNYISTFRRNPDRDSISVPTASLWPGTHQNMSYHKAALMLHTLERMHTWEVMQRVLSVFFARFKFGHPRPDDFFAALNEVTGKDHAWFVEQVYTSSNTFDYAVDRLVSEPITNRGLMEARAAEGTESSEYPKELEFQETEVEGQFRTTVVVRRLEAGQFPVDVLVTFSNGEQAREKWDGRGRWGVFTFDRPFRAVSAQIDPERVLLLDTNYTNNTRTAEPKADEAATKWTLRWMVWIQDLFMSTAFLI